MHIQPESFKSKLLKLGFNFYPTVRASGAWLTYISSDIRHVKLRLPLKLKTRNYVGTLCGGNMYAAVDGVYVVMLIKVLGRGYIVWDKSASIRYKKPARETLYAKFHLTEQELDTIKQAVAERGKVDRDYLVELKTAAGEVCAEITKTIHVKQKGA